MKFMIKRREKEKEEIERMKQQLMDVEEVEKNYFGKKFVSGKKEIASATFHKDEEEDESAVKRKREEILPKKNKEQSQKEESFQRILGLMI